MTIETQKEVLVEGRGTMFANRWLIGSMIANLKQVAFCNECTVTIEEFGGWIQKTVGFTIKGKPENVKKCAAIMENYERQLEAIK